jgi:peptidoglycan/LPS O-acetylase OafA/YrhL
LYPIHWVLLIFTIIIINITGNEYAQTVNGSFGLAKTPFEYITNITLIFPAWNPIEIAPRLSPATWALTIELFYYALIGLGISKNKKITIVWFLISISYLLLNWVLHNTYSAGYGNFLSASLPFSIGALTYHYKREIVTTCKKITVKYGGIAVLIFILNLIICSTSHNWAIEESWKVNLIGMYLNLLLSSIMIVFLYYEGKTFFTRKIDRFYGDLSYPLYLFHWSAACFFSWLLIGEPIEGVSTINLIIFLGALLFTILLSLFVNFIVSVPVEKVRRKIKNKVVL